MNGTFDTSEFLAKQSYYNNTILTEAINLDENQKKLKYSNILKSIKKELVELTEKLRSSEEKGYHDISEGLVKYITILNTTIYILTQIYKSGDIQRNMMISSIFLEEYKTDRKEQYLERCENLRHFLNNN